MSSIPNGLAPNGNAPTGELSAIAVVDFTIAPGEDGVFVREISPGRRDLRVPPRILSAVIAARGIFPFRFRGQPIFFALTSRLAIGKI